jgi:hypothetical protein
VAGRADRSVHLRPEHVTGDRELYDSVTEPYQANNQICSAPADLRDGLQWLTERLATCLGDSCRQVEGQ